MARMKGICPQCGASSQWEGALCWDCYWAAKDAARVEARNNTAAANARRGLSPISEGSEKQKAWAEEIRNRAFAALDALSSIPESRPANWPPELSEDSFQRAKSAMADVRSSQSCTNGQRAVHQM